MLSIITTLAKIRTYNGQKFIAEAIREWIKTVKAKTADIELHSLGGKAMARISIDGCETDRRTARSFIHCLKTRSSLKMGEPFQHQATIWCSDLPPKRTRGRLTDGPKANHVITFN